MTSTAQHKEIPVRPDWLALHQEDALDPGQVIVDSHHHLLDRPGSRYLVDDFLADLRSGHNIRATVFLQARAMYRCDGPEAMKPVGETEFANGVAAMFASGTYGDVRACAGIVGFADLTLGDAVRPVLEAHIAAAGGAISNGGRFRGVRQIATWDPDPGLLNPAYAAPEDLMDSAAFRAGIAHLGALGLSFETYILFPQIPRLTALARSFPDLPINLNHSGGVVGTDRFAGRRDEVFAAWSASLRDLAKCPNVTMKLGGLGMPRCGFDLETQARPPSSQALADAWKPWLQTCVEIFGAKRCMFESNFPVDKTGYSYAVGWNAMKRIFSGAGQEEKDDLFWRSAANFYRLPEHLFAPSRQVPSL